MNRLRKAFTENIGLKLLALGLAALLWAAVGSDPVTEATFRVPVEFVNVPRNLQLLTEEPSVQLWARGPSHAVREASAGDFTVRVNAAAIRGPGENTFSIDPAIVGAPPTLQVVELVPSEIRVTFEQTVSKEVPIHPQFSGEPKQGFEVKEFSVTPPEVSIAGPGSHVQTISAASTDPVDLNGLSDDKTFTANVYIPDPLVRSVTPKAIELKVEIQPSRRRKAGRRIE